MRWAMPAVKDVVSEYLCSLAAHSPKLNRELFVYVVFEVLSPKDNILETSWVSSLWPAS